MIILYVGILLIIYALISGNKYKSEVGFLFIFLIMGFQSGVDGDFYRYKDEFENFSWSSHFFRKEEYTWGYLTYFFQRFTTFPIFVCILSAFKCFVIFKFVQRFAGNNYKYLCAILFFFTFNYMMMQMKAMRQGLALELCITSLLLIDNEKKKSIYLAIITSILGYYSHHSSLICITLVWGYYFYLKSKFAKRNLSLSKMTPIIVTSLALALFILKKTVLDKYLVPIISTIDNDHYMNYAQDFIENSGAMSFLVVFYEIIVIFLLCWYLQYAGKKLRYLTFIAIIGMFTDILFFGTGSVQRILLYFSFTNFVIFPNIVYSAKKHWGTLPATIIIIILVGFALKTSVSWLISGNEEMFGQYKFIFTN